LGALRLPEGQREVLLSKHRMERFVRRVPAEVKLPGGVREGQLPEGQREVSLSKHRMERFVLTPLLRVQRMTGITSVAPAGTMLSPALQPVARWVSRILCRLM